MSEYSDMKQDGWERGSECKTCKPMWKGSSEMKEGFEAGFEPSGSLVIVGASAVVRLSPEDTKVFLTWLSERPEMRMGAKTVAE